MRIKDDNDNNVTWWAKYYHAFVPFFSSGSKRKYTISLLLNIILIAFIIISFSLFVFSTRNARDHLLYKMNIEPYQVYYALDGMKSENIRIPGHFIQGSLASPDHIYIDIKNNDFQRLLYQREMALSRGIWTGTDETVPVTIRYKDQTINADVRLKGNGYQHWGTDSISLKVKTKGDDRLLGMREFSIEKPWTRLYLTEWVFHRLLFYENLPHLQFSYADVQINGKGMGIYAIEEAPDDRLLEAKGFPAGPIFHMNDEIWEIRAAGYSIDDSPNVPIDVYNAEKYNSTDRNWQVRKGSDLLEAFRAGQISASDAFDIRTLATFMALSDLTGNYNGNYASNIRPYYNPVTSKLELIGNDAKTDRIDTIFYLDNRQFNRLVSNDPSLVPLYIHELERVSDPDYMERFLSVIDTDFRQNLSFMYKENPFYHFPREIYEYNQNIIRQTIYPYRCQYSYLDNVTANGTVLIEVGAAQPLPVEILGLRLNGELVPQTSGPTVVPGNDVNDVLHYQILTFQLTNGTNRITGQENITIDCRVYGTTPVRSESVFGKPRLSDWPLEEDIIRQQPNTEQVHWLFRDDKNMTFTILPGNWEISNDIIIPEGYTVLSQQGNVTQLDLTHGAMILSYSPLILCGEEDNPLTIISSDNSGQGIMVFDAENTSILSYVVISNLSVPDRNGWNLPSSVTFYRSPVIISHSSFSDGTGKGSLLSITQGNASIPVLSSCGVMPDS